MISTLHRCIFTHVPKTGGQSVLRAFGLPMTLADYRDPLPHILHPYGHRRLVLDRQFLDQGYFSSAFVRHPVSRLISGYSYLAAGGINMRDARYRDERLAQYGGDFRAFVEDLPSHLDAVHFRPQRQWLADDAGRMLRVSIGRFEALPQAWSRFAARAGLPAGLPHLNSSRHLDPGTDLDPGTLARIHAAYGDDYEEFGYVD